MDKWASKHTCTNVPFDKIIPYPDSHSHTKMDMRLEKWIQQMVQIEKKKKIDKKDGYNIVLGYFPVTTKQNISVQIVNFSSFPFKSGGEKNTFFYNKICGFFGFLLFLT